MSSDRSIRSKARIDYGIYHRTGEKVEKSDSFARMSNSDELKLENRRLESDIAILMELNELDEFDDLSMLSDHISELLKILRRFQDLHHTLEDELGSENYKKEFPKFKETFDRLKNEIKCAKGVKMKLKESERLKVEEIEGKQTHARWKDDIELCLCKVRSVLENFPISDLCLVEDIRLNIGKMSEYVATYNHLITKYKIVVDTDKADTGENVYKAALDDAVVYIQDGKTRIDDILQTMKTENDRKDQDSRKTIEESELTEEEIALASRRIQEISFIEESLAAFEKVQVKELGDEQLLDSQKGIKDVYNKCDSLSEKITLLYSQIPLRFEDRKSTLEKHSKEEKRIRSLLDLYRDGLNQEIAKRNVSKDKLSSNISLNISLKKFSGFDSVLDIYAFQAEFERLFIPRIQSKLLPDYLKYNYLEGSALTLVKGLDSLSDIWDRLKDAYGDTEILLRNKLKEVENLGPIWRCKDKNKLVQVLSKLLFVMTDLQDLARKHRIENDLYHGSGFQSVYEVIGHTYRDKFIRKYSEANLSKKDKWTKLIEFMKSELRVQEEILLVQKGSDFRNKSECNDKKPGYQDKKSYNSTVEKSEKNNTLFKCHLCGKSDHAVTKDHFGRQVVQYFACKMFVEMTPTERFKLLCDKGLCYQCLSPGTQVEHGKHKTASCFSKFVCPHPSHSQFPRKKHVLLCETHKKDANNISLLDKYKKENILKCNSVPEFSKNIKLSFYNSSFAVKSEVNEDEVIDSAIYILQTIVVEGEQINVFYDNGCGDFVCSKEAVSKLESKDKASLLVPGPIKLGGVGDIITISEYGIYKVDLCTWDGRPVTMQGTCLDQITCKLPKYPLERVEKDIIKSCRSLGGDSRNLPKLPEYAGGDTHLMIGIKYLKYHPEFVFQMPTGLSIYKSRFFNPDGSRGVVGGPHVVFTEIEKQLGESFMSKSTYFSHQLTLYRMGYLVNPDAKLLSGSSETRGDIELYQCSNTAEGNVFEINYPCVNCGSSYKSSSKDSRLFEEAEKAGSEITYRCVNCRNCVDCKKSEEIQCISIQEEVEQDIIDNSVHVDVEKGITIAKLPFLENPLTTLVSNKQTALSVYKAQVRKLNRNPKDKTDVIESERKMQKLGFVEKLENLTQEQRDRILSNTLQYFIPWRAVWNVNSLSTPCRLVFDASQITPSGYSLNSILAKGRNNMNKLVEILIRWFIRRFGFHTDIRKMYNTIKLDEEFWCYQLYLWSDELNLNDEPIVKVIMTLIYGVKSSGNQAESGLRKTARLECDKYPKASNTIIKDTYVDDCLSGQNTEEEVLEVTNNMQVILAKGGFSTKVYTYSGSDPPSEFSNDGVSVKVAGLKWFPKADRISIVTGDSNFASKVRGKKSSIKTGVPEDFTRRDCQKRVSEVFDLVGKVTPIICALKLDLRTLVNRRLNWDDKIPSDLKSIWLANFKTLEDLANVQYNRTVIPEDALNLDISTIDLGDASEMLICSAVYARILRKSGAYSCQLIFSRSKLVPEGTTIPRAELLAAQLNANIGHVVKLALGDHHKGNIKLTDSQVSLFWIDNTKNPLKQWVRNKVVEINRLADRSLWRYIKSEDNITDMGTRKGASIVDVSSDSCWINGLEWMRGRMEDFPVIDVKVLKFIQADIEAIKKESLRPEGVNSFFASIQSCPASYTVDLSCSNRKVDTKVLAERYEFSNYIIDPNKFRLRTVVRVLALVMLFVRNFVKKWGKSKSILNVHDCKFSKFSKNILDDLTKYKYVLSCGNVYAATSSVGEVSLISCQPGLVVCLSEEDVTLALNYFYKKCTLEVKRFTNIKSYERISTEKDEILYYTGRILPSQEFGKVLKMSDVMLDLTSSTFNVPLVDRYSPFAYAIVNEVHWNHPVAKHSGNETVWRYTLKYAYLLDGKELVRKFRKDCTRCRYLAKRTVDVVMGPVSKVNLMLAPAYYVSQVDLFGPLKAYSLHNKRSTVNIWFLVFCCCTTGAVSLKVMENYTTSAFILGFIRFSCYAGYPKMLLPDEGSQLVKGCKEMRLCFTDIKQKLFIEHGVEFETCPVGGHNMHGKIERKIQHVKQAMSRHLDKERLSVLQWETIGDQVANCVNDTPLAVRYIPRDVEQVDLLTPNRLMLGRNNDRSPSGPLCMSSNTDKLIEQNERIMRAWFECWLISHVPKLVEKPKWFSSDTDVKIGDVILFLKKDKEYAGNYQYGMIKNIERSRDQKIRTVIVEYTNSTESIRRETRRAVREIVVVHPVDELGIIRELGEISTWVDMKKKMNSTCSSSDSIC